MYFYYLQGWNTTVTDTLYPKFFVQPFVKNDTIFDENNLPQLEIGINGVNVVYLGIKSPYTGMLINHSYSSCGKLGFPYLVSSTRKLNSTYLASLNSKIINGKYKKNHNHETFPSREFYIGFTIPIKYSRTYNNKTLNFKYLTVSSYNEWNINSRSYDSSKTYMGSYSIPNVITSAPQDFSSIREALEAKGLEFIEAEIKMIPQNYISLEGDAAKKMGLIVDNLEDNDDVQDIWHNWEEEE